MIPLLGKRGGCIEYRIRPGKDAFIYSAEDELPYEIHLILIESEGTIRSEK